jgi:D-alanyl-lipoteichoic acid acyltransferase DltB (MBOAT superfamily)
MLFNSYNFLLFFPIVVFIYYVLPKNSRWVWLLVASYYFYMGWNAKYALLLLTSTAITYVSGCLLEVWKQRKRLCRWVVALSFLSNLSILFFFKYFDFAIENVNRILARLHMELLNPSFDVLLPVGISFYTFQALSYTMDVYRGEIKAEKNFFRYALFVSFFPQLVAGPIERSKNLLKQVEKPQQFDYRNLCDGLLLMTWGFFLKLVIADRIAIFVDHAYGGDIAYDGKYLLIATVLFAFQIYCDFAGYSTIAIGAAEVLGFHLMENFDCPYYSKTVAEFWRRWHISLSSWFKDYLYIPLGGNRKGKFRKYVNIMIVFVVSGLWHGASWSYVVWGGLNGIFQVIGEILKPLRDGAKKLFRPLVTKKFFHGMVVLAKVLVTFVLVDFTWIFFRADSMTQARDILSRIIHMNDAQLLANGTLYDLGLNRKNLVVLAVALLVLLGADLAKYRGLRLREVILDCNVVLRGGICLIAVLSILVFGIWGSGYQATNFIYFQF